MKTIYLNRFFTAGLMVLIIGYLWFKDINFIWYGFIAFTGFFIPLSIFKAANRGFLQSTFLYPILSISWLIMVGIYFLASFGVHLTAFLPVWFDPITYNLYRFSRITNESWLSFDFFLYYMVIPLLFGMSLLVLIEVPFPYTFKGKQVKEL
jgi:hypothetical protein